MGHVYRPNNPTFDAPFDPKRCAASVAFGGRSVGLHQCRRPGVIQDGGHLWCKGHAPATVKAKRAAQEAKWKAASDARKAERDTIESLRARCARLEGALAEIAKEPVRIIEVEGYYESTWVSAEVIDVARKAVGP